MAKARGLSPRSIAGQRTISEHVKSAPPSPPPPHHQFLSDNTSGKHVAGVLPSGISQWHHINRKGDGYVPTIHLYREIPALEPMRGIGFYKNDTNRSYD